MPKAAHRPSGWRRCEIAVMAAPRRHVGILVGACVCVWVVGGGGQLWPLARRRTPPHRGACSYSSSKGGPGREGNGRKAGRAHGICFTPYVLVCT